MFGYVDTARQYCRPVPWSTEAAASHEAAKAGSDNGSVFFRPAEVDGSAAIKLLVVVLHWAIDNLVTSVGSLIGLIPRFTSENRAVWLVPSVTSVIRTLESRANMPVR